MTEKGIFDGMEFPPSKRLGMTVSNYEKQAIDLLQRGAKDTPGSPTLKCKRIENGDLELIVEFEKDDVEECESEKVVFRLAKQTPLGTFPMDGVLEER